MNGRFAFSTNTHPADTFTVISFDGVETLSSPFRFEIHVRAASAELEEELIGKRALLRIGGTQSRNVGGIVVSARLDEVLAAAAVYRVELRPQLWTLGLGQDTRIFQDMSVPEIVDAVIAPFQIERQWRLSRTFSKRPYCVQYLESDLTFVQRLLAEEGILYAVVTAVGDEPAERMVLMDDAAYEPISEPEVLQFHPADGREQTDEAVETLSWMRHMATAQTTVSGFDFRRPTVRLEEKAHTRTEGAGSQGEVYAHDLDWDAFTVSAETAQSRLEQLRGGETMGGGRTRCVRMEPARWFTLEGHPRADLNRRFVVVSVEHRGRVPEEAGLGLNDEAVTDVYANEIRVVSDDVVARPARPERIHRQIVETATVVGPPGEEIYTDEHGRVKVQFHWDRQGKGDDHSSCWVRTMVPWAGAAWGAQFVPRVGMEVVVTFAGGNTDRPIIMGSLYNGANVPPFALPGKKTQSGIRTRSTPGGEGSNELRFDDAAGAEQIYLHAQRDLVEEVENDRVRNVGGHERVRVAKSRAIEVLQDHVRHVYGNEVATIEENLVINVVGAHAIHIGGHSDMLHKDEMEGVLVDERAPGEASALEVVDGPAAEQALQQAVRYANRSRGAQLTWLTEQLPDAVYEQGFALQQGVREIGNDVASGYLRAREIAASQGIEGIDPLEQELASIQQVIAARLDETLKPVAEPLHPLQTKLVSFLTDMDRAAGEARATLAAAKNGDPAPAAGVILGQMKGGGGAFKPGAAKEELKGKYEKSDIKLDKGSSLFSVEGDGAIICSGKLLLTAAHVIVSGPDVTVEGGNIKINGGTIAVTGGDVSVTGDIKLNC